MRIAILLAALLLPAAEPTPTPTADPPVEVHYYGAVRSNPGGWHVLSGPAHTPQGITGVTCSTGNGYLYVAHTSLTSVGTVTVTADETWAGPNHPGVSGGLATDVIIVRSGSGAVVRCDSAALSSPSGNIWIDGWGRAQ